jgi:hypothetical protein
MASLDVINPSDQMETTSKWKSCYWALTFVKERMAYKDKWEPYTGISYVWLYGKK